MSFKLALIQMRVSSVKEENLMKAVQCITTAAQNGAEMIILPECFNSPYVPENFRQYAEAIPGISTNILSKAAQENNVFIVGGSIPEEDQGMLYNTCTVFNSKGHMIAKFRKMHMADSNIKGDGYFSESSTVSPGDEFVTFDTPYCKIGICLCWDIRFIEMFQIYTSLGCKLMVIPGAFNMTTGPAHLKTLLKSRAIDNGVFVAFCSTARNEEGPFVAWGHSSVVNPWGDVITKAGYQETIIYCDINSDYVDEVRRQIPVLSQKRLDLYTTSTLC